MLATLRSPFESVNLYKRGFIKYHTQLGRELSKEYREIHKKRRYVPFGNHMPEVIRSISQL